MDKDVKRNAVITLSDVSKVVSLDR
jgi:hypothetical protein